MSRYSSHDPYTDPASGILKNRLGITDTLTLEATEAALVAVRSYELLERPLLGRFDLAHLQAIHRYLFGDVYEWAGQLRTIDISRDGSAFAHHSYIVSAAETVFRELEREKHLTGLDAAAFSDRAGHYLGEVNALHPFREGNGRAQREFFSRLAAVSGYYIAWENVERSQMLDGSIESFRGNPAKLQALISANLHDFDSDTAVLSRTAKSSPPSR
jgi:fido (protein-threonine AMPylation protein)